MRPAGIRSNGDAGLWPLALTTPRKLKRHWPRLLDIELPEHTPSMIAAASAAVRSSLSKFLRADRMPSSPYWLTVSVLQTWLRLASTTAFASGVHRRRAAFVWLF